MYTNIHSVPKSFRTVSGQGKHYVIFGGSSSSYNILNMDIRVRHMHTQILALLCAGVSSSEFYVIIMPTDSLELLNEKIHDKCLAHRKL